MSWTNVAKPTESSVVAMTGGVPLGLLIAITTTTQSTSVTSGWTGVAKPTTYGWTNTAKPSVYGWTNVAKPTT